MVSTFKRSGARVSPIKIKTWGQPLTGDKMDENGMKGTSVQREMMGMIFKRSLKG